MEISGVGAVKAKRRIDVDIALNDIRSGLDDASLMQKYRVSARGLQSLFNKLVRAGSIELAELDRRMPAFMGTVFVFEEGLAGGRPPDGSGTVPSIDLDETLKDIREGMEDADLMAKYNLSAQGLESLFDHLVFTGLITRMELDLRMPSVDSTVDLRGLIKKLADGKEMDFTCEDVASEPVGTDGCSVGVTGQDKCTIDCTETASKLTEKLWPKE